MLSISDSETGGGGGETLTVKPGEDPGVTTLVDIWFKSFANTGNKEIYLGGPERGVGSQRVETDFIWSSLGTHSFVFIYDSSSEELSVNLDGAILSKGGYTGNGWNYLQIYIYNRDDETTVELNNLVMDGYSLGDYTSADHDTWHISDYDFSDDFTLTVEIDLDGEIDGSDEESKIEIRVNEIT